MVKRSKAVSKSLSSRRVGKRVSKKDRAQMRLKTIHKKLLTKKIAKREKKRKAGHQRRKEDVELEEGGVEEDAPVCYPATDEGQMEMLNLLGLLGTSDQNAEWEQVLEQRLHQVSQQSTDNPQVKRVYGEIARIFATYRSGRVPKAFKIIPNLDKWREVLDLSRPQEWTPQAMFQAVAIFTSALDSLRAETFFRHYLVPAVRLNLQKNHKLNYHYYEALRKGLYKTNAWFKGVLFQLCGEKCLLREIKVIESLLSSMTIPVLSSSVAMVKMMELPPSSAITHYLLALLSKGYSLPQRVIQSLVTYLLTFENNQDDLPVVWHQLFLALVRQYAAAIDQMAKSSLLHLAQIKKHPAITPQIITLLA